MNKKVITSVLILSLLPQALPPASNLAKSMERTSFLPPLSEELRYFYKIPSRYQDICRKLSEELDIPFKVMYNLVQKESGWNNKSKGKNKNGSYDIGLTQLNSSNFEYFYWKILKQEVREGFNYDAFYMAPEKNLETGFRYLRWLLDYFDGDYYSAVMAYNCGLTKVRTGRVPKSTYEYVSFILN